jgi:hypothetical protein
MPRFRRSTVRWIPGLLLAGFQRATRSHRRAWLRLATNVRRQETAPSSERVAPGASSWSVATARVSTTCRSLPFRATIPLSISAMRRGRARWAPVTQRPCMRAASVDWAAHRCKTGVKATLVRRMPTVRAASAARRGSPRTRSSRAAASASASRPIAARMPTARNRRVACARSWPARAARVSRRATSSGPLSWPASTRAGVYGLPIVQRAPARSSRAPLDAFIARRESTSRLSPPSFLDSSCRARRRIRGFGALLLRGPRQLLEGGLDQRARVFGKLGRHRQRDGWRWRL